MISSNDPAYRQNKHHRINETQPVAIDKASILGARSTTKRPLKLTDSFIKEQLGHNQQSTHASQVVMINFTDQRVSLSPDSSNNLQGGGGNNLLQGPNRHKIKLAEALNQGNIPVNQQDEGGEDLVSSDNSILEGQDGAEATNMFQRIGSMDNPNLPRNWNNINYKK